MKKIIVLNEALKFRPETLDLAAFIARLSKSKVVGLFFEGNNIETSPSVKSFGGQLYVEEIIAHDEEQAKITSDQFKNGCIQREVDCIVRHSNDELLINETRYADLLVIPAAISHAGDNDIPSKLLLKMLHDAECPVIVAPEYFQIPEEIVFAYDGSRSAAFAIKQFYYQLPELADKKITILHVNTDSEYSDQYEGNDHFVEWLDLHFQNVSFHESNGDVREGLFKYFIEYNQQKNKLLVIGSFGRNMLSSFFKKSAADLVLKAIDAPVFIAHY